MSKRINHGVYGSPSQTGLDLMETTQRPIRSVILLNLESAVTYVAFYTEAKAAVNTTTTDAAFVIPLPASAGLVWAPDDGVDLPVTSVFARATPPGSAIGTADAFVQIFYGD